MRLRMLDGLRGLAALIVVLDHYAISFFPAMTDGTVSTTHNAGEWLVERTPLHLLVSGNFSVCIFFVLSGFVLSSKFFRTGSRRAVVSSAIKRYVRLTLPIFACVMLAFGLINFHLLYNDTTADLTGSDWLGQLWQFSPSLIGAIYHGLLGVHVAGASKYNTVLWTMQTELLGSFLVFGILLAAGKWRYRYLIYALLGIALFNTYYLAFILGVAMCDFYFNGDGPRVQKLFAKGRWIPLAAACLFLGSSPVGTLAGTPFQYLEGRMPFGLPVTTTTHLIGAIGLVFVLVHVPMMQKPLNWRPFQYLGRISFGLYLTHLLVLGSLSSLIFAKIVPHTGYRLGFLLMAAISAPVIWLMADLFTRYADEPAITLSAKFYALCRRSARRLGVYRPKTKPASLSDQTLPYA